MGTTLATMKLGLMIAGHADDGVAVHVVVQSSAHGTILAEKCACGRFIEHDRKRGGVVPIIEFAEFTAADQWHAQSSEILAADAQPSGVPQCVAARAGRGKMRIRRDGGQFAKRRCVGQGDGADRGQFR